MNINGENYGVSYLSGESDSGMFGEIPIGEDQFGFQ